MMKSPQDNTTTKFWQSSLAIIWKDWKIELRKKSLLSSMLIFSLMIVLIFTFALDLDKSARENVAIGILWVTFVFAATLGLNQTIALENENSTLDGILLSPIDQTSILVGKFISTFIFVTIIEAFVMPIYYILFEIPWFSPKLIVVILLGTFGYTLVGTLLATIAMRTQYREIILPILLFPVATPIIISAVQCSNKILSGASWNQMSGSFNLLIVYDIIFVGIAIMTFDHLIKE